MLTYFDLSIATPRRLAMMRRDFADHGKRYPHCPEHAKPASWRELRHYTLANYAAAHGTLDTGSNDGNPVWYCHTGPYFGSRESFADEMTGGPDHRGWFTDDEMQLEVARGIVARLSHGRFIAGYHWSANDERVYFPDVYTDEREAKRAADREAERFAEDCRLSAIEEAEAEAEHEAESRIATND